MRLPLIGVSVIAVLACAAGAYAGEPVVEPAAPTLTLENFDPPMFGDRYPVNQPSVPNRRGAFKIAENESPQPQDRIYLNYNFFDSVKHDLVPGREDVHRETLGVEKTLFGDASIGLRLPFFEGIDTQDFKVGDLSFLLKYAAINHRDTGDALSLGLIVTAPTGQIPDRFDAARNENVHDALVSPFIGYVWNWNNFFVHGFHSIMVATDSSDVTEVFNDLGFGYWLCRTDDPGRLVTGVIPTFEVHVNTPVNHRVGSTPQVYRDIVDLTFGSHFEFKKRYILGVAAVTPVTNPRGFDFEVIANLNFRF